MLVYWAYVHLICFQNVHCIHTEIHNMALKLIFINMFEQIYVVTRSIITNINDKSPKREGIHAPLLVFTKLRFPCTLWCMNYKQNISVSLKIIFQCLLLASKLTFFYSPSTFHLLIIFTFFFLWDIIVARDDEWHSEKLFCEVFLERPCVRHSLCQKVQTTNLDSPYAWRLDDGNEH